MCVSFGIDCTIPYHAYYFYSIHNCNYWREIAIINHENNIFYFPADLLLNQSLSRLIVMESYINSHFEKLLGEIRILCKLPSWMILCLYWSGIRLSPTGKKVNFSSKIQPKPQEISQLCEIFIDILWTPLVLSVIFFQRETFKVGETALHNFLNRKMPSL